MYLERLSLLCIELCIEYIYSYTKLFNVLNYLMIYVRIRNKNVKGFIY